MNLLTLLRVYVTVRCPSVCPSVCPIYRPLQQRVAGLLLWARRTKDIHRLLHGRRSAATASSVTLSADVGSWTQTTCFCPASLWTTTSSSGYGRRTCSCGTSRKACFISSPCRTGWSDCLRTARFCTVSGWRWHSPATWSSTSTRWTTRRARSSSAAVRIYSRPHRTFSIDADYCCRPTSVVCLSVCMALQSGWTTPDILCDVYRTRPKEPCIKWGV